MLAPPPLLLLLLLPRQPDDDEYCEGMAWRRRSFQEAVYYVERLIRLNFPCSASFDHEAARELKTALQWMQLPPNRLR
jgi:hypothetical protein